uniref:Uncharacterized protein n=1 Tax=Aegilops tauschii subsp. strangulata TaxID=200361 RepID=A0A452YN98_AEGTS
HPSWFPRTPSTPRCCRRLLSPLQRRTGPRAARRPRSAASSTPSLPALFLHASWIPTPRRGYGEVAASRCCDVAVVLLRWCCDVAVVLQRHLGCDDGSTAATFAATATQALWRCYEPRCWAASRLLRRLNYCDLCCNGGSGCSDDAASWCCDGAVVPAGAAAAAQCCKSAGVAMCAMVMVALGRQGRRPCCVDFHQRQRRPDRTVQERSKGVPLRGFEDEKFCYVALRRGKRPEEAWPLDGMKFDTLKERHAKRNPEDLIIDYGDHLSLITCLVLPYMNILKIMYTMFFFA